MASRAASFIILLALLATARSVAQPANAVVQQHPASMRFTENRGQLVDTRGELRPDILYTASSAGVQLYLRTSGISYIFSRIDNSSDQLGLARPDQLGLRLDTSTRITRYRMDMEMIGARADAEVTSEEQSESYTNYYLAHCPNGITGVHSYGRIIYHEIYPKIDLVLHGAEGGMKYDFVVRPGGRVADIQLRYVGADSIRLSEQGTIRVGNMLGGVKEGVPVSYQGESRTAVESRYHLEGETIGFDVGNYDHSEQLVIDPTLLWSTYYGGSNYESSSTSQGASIDRLGNLIFAGYTQSSDFPVSTGALQTVFGGVGDAVVVKMNGSGGRVWATYYGGSGNESGYALAIDASANIYFYGAADSTFPVSSGAFQSIYGGGGSDQYLVKLDSTGARLWGTFYGGNGYELGGSVAIDSAGNVVISGATTSAGLATSGAFQTSVTGYDDAFVAKFSAAGNRLWMTYFGGSIYERWANTICVDPHNNIILAGSTSSTNLPVTPGAYQTISAGGNYNFLAKFDPNGGRIWATYYGGGNADYVQNVVTDLDSNIITSGYTYSSNYPTTTGAIQSSLSGSMDGFITTFNAAGNLRWSTYLGGNSNFDQILGVTTDLHRNVIAVGWSSSTNFPVTSDAYQSSLANISGDAVIIKLDSSGHELWGTYFGGSNNNSNEAAYSVITDRNAFYVIGNTNSTNFPVTSGAYQPTNAGSSDLFIAKFCDVVPLVTIIGSTTICPGDSTRLQASAGFDSYHWSTGATTPSITVKQGGNYSISATFGACSGHSDTVHVTVYQTTRPRITPGGSIALCAGDSSTLDIPPTYRSQRWSTGATSRRIVVRSAGTYYVDVVDSNGCSMRSDSVRVIVNLRPKPTITVNGPTPPLCEGDTVELDGGAGYRQYAWSTNETSRKIRVAESGTYMLLVVDTNGCSASTQTKVEINPLPWQAISVLGTTTICRGDSVLLDAGFGYRNYQWSTGERTQRITVRDAGRYSARFESQAGCPGGTDTVEIKVNAKPSANISGPIAVCPNGNAFYAVVDTSGVSYHWSITGGSGVLLSRTDSSQITVQWGTSGTGTVNVIITDRATGCRSESEVNVDVGAGIKPKIIADHLSGRICNGDSIILDAGPGYAKYQWSSGETTRHITTGKAQAYSVTVTDGGGCSGSSDPFIVIINADPTPTIQAFGPTVLCPGDSVVLDAGDYSRYLWSNGASIRRILVRDSGSYSVTVTDSAGCSGTSAAVAVSFHAPPKPVINGPNVICLNATGTYSVPAIAGDSYQWTISSGGTITNGQGTSSVTIHWSGAGSETVDLEQTSSATGCRGNAERYIVNVGTTLAPKITAPAGTDFCVGDSITLAAPAGYATYLWSTGETTPEIRVGAAGIYRLSVNDNTGCSGSDSIAVSMKQLPHPFIEPEGPIRLCDGDSVVLKAADGYKSYLWSSGQTTQQIVVYKAGSFSVTAANEEDCRGASEVVEVIVNTAPPKPIISVNDKTLTSTAATTYQWYYEGVAIAGATAQSYIATQPGQYTVTISDGNGCHALSESVGIFEGSAMIALGEYEAVPGEHLTIPLTLTGAPSLDNVGAYHYRTTIRFFKALLYPTGATPFGIEQGADRIVTIEGMRGAGVTNGAIGELEFIAALGDTLATPLHIETFEWTDGRASVLTTDGVVRIRPEGGWQHYLANGRLTLSPVVPNPAVGLTRVVYETIEPGLTQLYLSDPIGRRVLTLLDGVTTPRRNVVSFDAGELSSGVYFLVLQTPTGRLVQPMQVQH